MFRIYPPMTKIPDLMVPLLTLETSQYWKTSRNLHRVEFLCQQTSPLNKQEKRQHVLAMIHPTRSRHTNKEKLSKNIDMWLQTIRNNHLIIWYWMIHKRVPNDNVCMEITLKLSDLSSSLCHLLSMYFHNFFFDLIEVSFTVYCKKMQACLTSLI